jgi:hypothetical protein
MLEIASYSISAQKCRPFRPGSKANSALFQVMQLPRKSYFMICTSSLYMKLLGILWSYAVI